MADLSLTALGVDTAVKTAGMTDKVKIIGQSPEVGSFASLQAKTNEAWVGNPFRMVTWYLIDGMARYSLGMDLGPTDNAFMPNQIYTKDTLPDPLPEAGDGPTGYQDVFKKLWQVMD
jgi:hypothetical protein